MSTSKLAPLGGWDPLAGIEQVLDQEMPLVRRRELIGVRNELRLYIKAAEELRTAAKGVDRFRDLHGLGEFSPTFTVRLDRLRAALSRFDS